MKPDHEKALDVLKNRDGLESEVVLKNGKSLRVWNIAWGYDLGETIAHIITNISQPDQENERPSDFFYADDVVRILDADDSGLRFERFDHKPQDDAPR